MHWPKVHNIGQFLEKPATNLSFIYTDEKTARHYKEPNSIERGQPLRNYVELRCATINKYFCAECEG
jgi:hypothetical protein